MMLRRMLAGLAIGGSIASAAHAQEPRFEPIPPTAAAAIPPALRQPAPQTASAYRLDDLQAFAEQASPNLRAAAAAISAARGKALQAGLYPNPLLQGGSPQWGGDQSQYYGGIAQEFVTHGKLRLDQQAACQEVYQARLRFVRARFDLITAVRQQFYSTLASQRRIEILEALVAIAKRSNGTAVKLERSGEATRAETLFLEIEVEKAEVALENALARLAGAQRSLAAVVGMRDLIIERVHGDLVAPLPNYEAELLARGFLSENALVQIARVEVSRQRLLLRRAEVEPLPNVTVSGAYLYNTPDPHNNAMLEFSLPIPVWNRNQGHIAAAQSGVVEAAANIGKVENELTSQLAVAVARHIAAGQLAERYEQRILPKARESFDLTRRGYELGQFDFLRLLQAERTLVEADLNYVESLELRWTSAAEIAGVLQHEVFP